MTFAALLDTCVLYPMHLRDSLLRLAIADLYRPLWSPHILQELQGALVRRGSASPDQASRIIGLLREHFPEAEVLGYETLIPAMACHEKDRHVLAAAVKAGAGLLVTDNISDFPAASALPHGVEVLTADQFLLELLDTSPRTVITVLRRQADGYKRDPKTLDGLLATLSRSGLGSFASEAHRLIF
ncbi:PIN domain-containing protein [Pseudofrankia sp. DC12]|uniref:PIN domain-containing protein n=1 Tax=Pseudofrankia sp. DC12 TaxID=683315 RepID=UPI0005F7AAF5|nr:PIN domain-containing protein [Pseudofrankia sp. DC12]